MGSSEAMATRQVAFLLGLALILARGFADDKLCDKEHMKPINLETGRTDFIKGPELDINYKVEISNLKVQNDGKVLKVVGFKSSSIKYRTTTYQLEEIRFRKHSETKLDGKV